MKTMWTTIKNTNMKTICKTKMKNYYENDEN